MAATRRSFSLVSSLVLAASVAASGLAEAQWTYRAAPHAYVRGLNVFPNNPSPGTTTLVATTWTSGVFVLQDVASGPGPYNWVARNNGLPTLRLRALRPLTVNDMYVATEGSGVYRTTDGGLNWSSRNGVGITSLGCHDVRSVAIPGTITSTVYAGTACTSSSGVWKSTDSGVTWGQVGVGTIPADANVGSITASNDGVFLYAATSDHGLWRSADSGATWAQVSGISATSQVFNATFVGTGTNILLAYVFGDGVYKSTDSGVNWTASSTGLPANAIANGGMSRDGVANTTFYLALDGQGIYRSTNSGDSWSLWGTSDNWGAVARTVQTDGSSAGKYYIGTLEGVKRTTTNGSGAQDIDGDAMRGGVSSINHDWSSPRTAWLLAASPVRITDVYGSYEDEGNFADLEAGLTGHTYGGSIRQDPLDMNKVFVMTANRGIFRSINRGDLWTPINAGLPSMHGQGNLITIDRGNSQVIYLGLTDGGGVYKSTNGGDSWSAANTGLPTHLSRSVRRVSIVDGQGATLYAATAGGVYKSTDSAASWTLVFSAFDGGAMPLGTSGVQANAAAVYIANDHRNPNGSLAPSSGIWKTTDGGANWTLVLDAERVRNVFADANGVVYAGLDAIVGDQAFARSLDGGANWEEFSTGLTGSRFGTVGFDSRGQKLYSMSTNLGFFTLPAPVKTVRDLSGDGRSDILLRGSSGEIVAWLMNGNAISSATLMLGGGSGYQAVRFGDFNGDGKQDLLVVGAGGDVVVWLMNGDAVASSALVLGGGSGYVIDKLGDFNGDGKSDIVFRGAGGDLILWLMDGTAVASSTVILGTGTGFAPAAVGDFNNDGNSDIVLAHTDGRVSMWLMNGSTIASSANLLGAGTGFTVSHVGDFNGDSMDDLLFKGAGGEIVMWQMNGTTIASSTLLSGATPWQITHIADVNNDNRDDMVLKGPAGEIVIWQMNGAAITGSTLMYGGGPWLVTHAGDYNGDGMGDLLLKGPGGEIVVWIMNGSTITSATLLVGATAYIAAP